MNISQMTNVNYNFGRALTTNERKAYADLVDDAKNELGIKDTTAIVFDFNVPSEKGYNTGIGTTFSDSMAQFVPFLKAMAGVTSIQIQPQGKITPTNTSPYSGTNYAYGEHIIDLKKLTTPEYASLLDEKTIEEYDSSYEGDKHIREFRTDYSGLIGGNGFQTKCLESAYNTFIQKIKQGDISALRMNFEFENFKLDNQDWLQKDALYEVLSKKYRTSDIKKWDEVDKNLFDSSYPENIRQARIFELEKNEDTQIDIENFKQFIADKQQKESRAMLNSQDVQLYGDCLIGFSQGEMWANKNCFKENMYYGGPDPNCPETNSIQTWGLPALDYTKLGECSDDGDLSKLGEVGKFLYDKYSLFFKRYDGIRMDAAWQFVTPFIYQAVNGSYEEIKLPEINFTIFNIMKAAAKDVLGDKFDEQNPDNIMLELVGMSADKSRSMTLNKYPHLYTTAYSEYDERPKKFFDKGYKDGKFCVGVTCHDNDTLVNMAKDDYKRQFQFYDIRKDYPHFNLSDLAFDVDGYKTQPQEERIQENYRTAKLSEIFTTARQFFTLPDMFGMSERINISGKTSKDNWTVRIPSDYEKFYFTQLSNGFGLNLPKALANAMRMKGIDNPTLIQKSTELANILRSKGPMTEDEANKALQNGTLKNQFEYSI